MDKLDIELLGRTYSVACPPDEREKLLSAVRLLDQRFTDAQRRTKANGERLAVMTALNLAHELLQLQHGNTIDTSSIKRRIEDMKARLDAAIQAPGPAAPAGNQPQDQSPAVFVEAVDSLNQ